MKSEGKNVATSNTRCVTANLGTVAKQVEATAQSIVDTARDRLYGLVGKNAAAVAAGVLSVGMAAQNLNGAFITDIGNDNLLVLNGRNFAGLVVSIHGTNNVGAPFVTQGVRLNDWHILTQAHVIPGPTSAATINWIGDGTNYISNPGTIVTPESWIRHPDYVNGDTFTPDVGIIKLSSPLPGPTLDFVAPVVGEKYYVVGFGPIDSPSTEPVWTGDIRAWEMSADELGVLASPDLYFDSRRTTALDSGYGINGDSSSFLFDNELNIVGSLKAGSASPVNLTSNTTTLEPRLPREIGAHRTKE